jgi:predicted transcriptional regulator
MEDLDDISLLIKGKRKVLGISQKRLARYVRMSQSTVARLESDIKRLNPSYETIYKVISTLDNLSSIDTKGRMFSKTAGEIMQKRIIYARPGDPVTYAIKLIQDYDFPQLPVIDRDMNIFGAVSRKKLMAIATDSPQNISRMKVAGIVDEELPRVGKDTELGKIKKILEDWDAVLVVERSKAIGIITIYDVLKQI